ncbi:MAG: acyl carrier protein [Gemmatimonadaceae bacterium]|nr:acyl carrier protein [Gemmatimonadaceae bacterium]
MIDLSAVLPIFRDVLDQPSLVLSRDSSGFTVDGWDSLAHINIVSAIEEEFRLRFALGELQELKNVGEMVDLINRKLGTT